MEILDSVFDLERAVLQKMHSRKRWGKFHIRREKVIRSGFPSHLRGEVSKTIDILIKKGWIAYHDVSKGAISLNPLFREQIITKIAEGHA